jgi:PhnB protein
MEAFEFYNKHLDGVIGPVLRYRDSPVSDTVPDKWQDKIIHGSIIIDSITLAGSDVMPQAYQKPAGFCLLLRLASDNKVKTLFETFKEDGNVVLPPQKTFWSPCYAIVEDRFGVPWKFNCVA